MKLITILVIVAFLVLAAIAAIIVAFALVTSDSVEKAVLGAVRGELDYIRSEIVAVSNRVSAPAKILRRMIKENNQDTLNLPASIQPLASPQSQLNPFQMSMQLLVSHLDADPSLSYVYMTAKSPYAADHWVDFGSGVGDVNAYLEVPDMTSKSSILDGGAFPINLVADEIGDRQVTGETWQVETALLPKSAEENGQWFSIASFWDSVTNLTTSLATYSIPMNFDASGMCIQALNVDVSVDYMATLLKKLATKSNTIYIVDARNLTSADAYVNAMIVSSLPEKQLPFFDPDTEVPYGWTETPNAAVNALMRRVRDEIGGEAAAFTLTKDLVIENYKDDIIGITPVSDKSGLHFIVVSQTPRSYYLADAELTMNGAIGGGVGALVLCVIAFVCVHLAVVRPVGLMLDSMRKIANLQDGALDKEDPFLDELKPVHAEMSRLDTAIQSFARYVPKDIVVGLLASSQLCVIGMSETEAICCFVDICQFTSLTERVGLEALGPLTHIFFEQQTTLIMTHGGTVLKYIGDCIMSAWGAPLAIPHAEALATLCFLRMQRECRIDPIFTAFDEVGEQVNIRIGSAKGMMMHGTMGCTLRCAYDAMGDPTNLSSRLEGANKMTGTGIMVNEEIAIGAMADANIAFRLLGRIKVVGKEVAVSVYEPCGVVLTAPRDARGNDGDTSSNSTGEVDMADLGGTVELAKDGNAAAGGNSEVSRKSSFMRKRTASLAGGSRRGSVGGHSLGNHSGRSQMNDDTMSQASHAVFGSLSEQITLFEKRLAEGRKLCEVTAGRRAYAKRFTKAAQLFLNGEFAGAADSLMTLHDAVMASGSKGGTFMGKEDSAVYGSGGLVNVPSEDMEMVDAGGMSPVNNDLAAVNARTTNSGDFDGKKLPMCDWLQAMVNHGGPKEADKAWGLLRDIALKYAQEPPEDFFGAIQLTEK